MAKKLDMWSGLPGFCYSCLRIGMDVNHGNRLNVCKDFRECMEFKRTDMGKRLQREWESE